MDLGERALERQLHDTLSELELTISLADTLWQLDPALGPLFSQLTTAQERELAGLLRRCVDSAPD